MGYVGRKPASAALTAADISPAAITGQPALGGVPADADDLLISDAGVIKKVAYSNVKTTPTTITYPTFTSVTPDTVTNDLTSVVIVGTNFGGSGIPAVEFQSSTGAIFSAATVTRNSATQLTVGVQLATDGTYFIRIELNTGLAVRTSGAELTVSDAPVWTTTAGSLGTIAGNFSGAVATVAATGDSVTFTEVTSGGNVLTSSTEANCSLATGGAITTSDFGGADTAATLFTFKIRATDAQSQTADREFTLTSSYGATGGGQFN